MIVTPHSTPSFSVDVGRPSILNEHDLQTWKAIHKWVKTSDTPVVVSPAFRVVDNFIDRGQFYQGGGYRYMFWFSKKEDKDVFVEKVRELLQL